MSVTKLYGEPATQRLRATVEAAPQREALACAVPLFDDAEHARRCGLTACATLLEADGANAVTIRAGGALETVTIRRCAQVTSAEIVRELRSPAGLSIAQARLATKLDEASPCGLRFFASANDDAFTFKIPRGDSALGVGVVVFERDAAIDVAKLRSCGATAFAETRNSAI